MTPTGLAISPNGNIYIANQGYVAGEGEIIELQSVPEKQSPLGLLLVTSACVLIFKTKGKSNNS